MASTYSSNLKIELIATGEQAGLWGATTNDNFTNVFEQAIVGRGTANFPADADLTLTFTDSVSSQTARNVYLNVTSGVSLTQTRNLIVPTINKNYVVQNNTTGSQSIVVKTSAGTGITVPNGFSCAVYVDGTNVIQASNYFPVVTATQVNITGQGDLRLEDTTGGEYVALQAPGTLASSYTLTLPVDDGTNGQALITDGSGNLSWSTAASGDVYGPASATDNAIARFDGTTGKLIQNSVVTIADTTGDISGVGQLNATTLDATNIEVTNIKAKDGTAAITITDSTGAVAVSTAFAANGGATLGDASGDALTINSSAVSIPNGLTFNSGAVTLSSNPTLSAGTANGVLYLNGSKAATSGSALTFNGTNAFVFGDGSSSTFTASRSSNGNTFTIRSGTGADSALVLSGDTTTVSNFVSLKSWNGTSYNEVGVYGNGSSGYTYFNLAGSERMRITNAGNVGIGTSSPSSTLDARGIGSFGRTSAGAAIQVANFQNFDTSNNTAVEIAFNNSTTFNVNQNNKIGFIRTNSPAAGDTDMYINLQSAGNTAQRLYLNSSGNLGLGVTPSSSWWGNLRVLQVGYGASLAGGNGLYATLMYLGANYYTDGTNNRYLQSDFASIYQQVSGTHKWFTAPSGTAGNTITFTQAMTLDASGNLGIGTTSIESFGGGYKTLEVAGSTNTEGGVFKTATSGSAGSGSTGTEMLMYTDSVGGKINVVSAHPAVFYTANTERMRIDSSGNVGIGISSPQGRLYVNGADTTTIGDRATAALVLNNLNGVANNRYNSILFGGEVGNTNSAAYVGFRYTSGTASGFGDLVFGTRSVTTDTAPTERMRIDSSGNVRIGTTGALTTNERLTVATTTTDTYSAFQQSSGITAVFGVDATGAYSGSYTNQAYVFRTNNTERMRITSGGEVYIAGTTDQGAYNLQVNGTGVWGAGAYVNGSDERIKDNIAPLNSGLDVVSKLNPVTYKYKEDWSKDQSTQTGFIAQELLTALEGKNYVDGVVQQGGEYMSVAYQNIIPILTKAIQEQQAMIEELKQEVALLKSK